MWIDFRKHSLLLFLGLLVVQPVFAQSESIDNCTAEIDGDPNTMVDIDDDDDGLIELCYLDDVDAIRHSPNGTSLRRGTQTLTEGCDEDGDDGGVCRGYELVRDLDFTTTQSYISGTVNNNWVLSADDFTGTAKLGWEPIGGTFSGTFEGNGYHISNLQINRDGTSNVGLFTQSAASATIRNFGLSAIEVQGNATVGGIIGSNSGSLINDYVN